MTSLRMVRTFSRRCWIFCTQSNASDTALRIHLSRETCTQAITHFVHTLPFFLTNDPKVTCNIVPRHSLPKTGTLTEQGETTQAELHGEWEETPSPNGLNLLMGMTSFGRIHSTFFIVKLHFEDFEDRRQVIWISETWCMVHGAFSTSHTLSLRSYR